MEIFKNLSELSLNISEDEYRKLPAWSYSNISTFDREGITAVFEEVKPTTSLIKGSLLDTMLTNQDELNNLFFKYDGKFPKDNLLDIANQIIECNEEWEYFSADQLKTIAKANNYGADNWKPETIKTKLEESIKPYVDAIRVAGKKTVISQEIYQEATNMSEEMLKKFYIFFRNHQSHPHIQVYHQLKFMTEYNQIPIRCMFDILLVDYKNKTIIPADLKSTYASESEFIHSILKYRYFYQGFMYTYILKKVLSQDPYFKDFTILPFRFLVISGKTLTPFMYILEKSNIYDYVMPPITDNFKTIRPWQEVLTDLDTTVKVESKYKVVENNGLLYVNVLDDGIVISSKSTHTDAT